jgi:hypothetical protein
METPSGWWSSPPPFTQSSLLMSPPIGVSNNWMSQMIFTWLFAGSSLYGPSTWISTSFLPGSCVSPPEIIVWLETAPPPRAWFSYLSNCLIELCFHGSRADTSLFIYGHGAFTIFILIYADDILVISPNPILINSIISKMQGDFLIKDLGTINYFLVWRFFKTPEVPSSHNVDIYWIFSRNPACCLLKQ